VNKTRWCVLRWPTPSMAQAAGMSTEAFENLYFDVCTMDYAKMARADDAAGKVDEKTDRVRLVAPGTDLSFSIKGIGAKMCKATATFPTAKFFRVHEKFRKRHHPVQHADALYRHEV